MLIKECAVKLVTFDWSVELRTNAVKSGDDTTVGALSALARSRYEIARVSVLKLLCAMPVHWTDAPPRICHPECASQNVPPRMCLPVPPPTAVQAGIPP